MTLADYMTRPCRWETEARRAGVRLPVPDCRWEEDIADRQTEEHTAHRWALVADWDSALREVANG